MKKGLLIAILVVCLSIFIALTVNFARGGIWVIEGLNGKDGADGANGADGQNGLNGSNGANGKSAYELAVEDGFHGTLHEWLLSLAVRGMDGTNGTNGKDGVGVQNVHFNEEGHLIITLTDGKTLDAGVVGSGGGSSFSDTPDEMGFYEVYEMVVMTGYSALNLRLSPDLQNGTVYTVIEYGTVLLRTGDQKTENGYSRFLYNGTVCYARSSNFEMKYNYKVDIPAYNLPPSVVLTKDVQSWFYTDQIMPNIPENFKLAYSYSGSGERIYSGTDAFAITPTATGEAALTVRILQYQSGEPVTVATETVEVTVVEKNTSLSLTGLFIGDSRISGGDMLKAMAEAMPNLRFIGTRLLKNTDILHEGRGAWSTEHYLSHASSSVSGIETENAFYNSATGGFDFSYYMQKNGFSQQTLDFVVINLGANDSFSEQSVQNIKTMTDSIRAYSADIKILILSEYISPADGYYLSGSANRNVDTMRKKQLQYIAYLKEQFEGKESENIYLLPNYLAINSFSDWPVSNVQTENGTAEKITDVVHLGAAGYGKEAAMLRAYLYRLFT